MSRFATLPIMTKPEIATDAEPELALAYNGPGRDSFWMWQALLLADKAEREDDEIPVGALIVDPQGRLIGQGGNRSIREHDASAHAEIVAIRQAGQALRNYRLNGCTMYVTLEPCAMCAAAIIHARLERLVYAASNPKAGACGSVFDVLRDPRHNHRVHFDGGVLVEEASQRLSAYFQRKRESR